jgi:hypothetical protein
MPLKKILPRAGVNRENTRYTTEGGWYDCDKIRFRQGTPEKIGGWLPYSTSTFEGVCRSLFNWETLAGLSLLGVGTNLKFYINQGGLYFDVTPIRSTVTLTDPFDTTDESAVVTVTDVAHGCITGDFVTFSGATTVGGLDLNNEYQVTVVDADTYTITAASPASSTANGGGTVTADYQINTGAAINQPLLGWGAGGWGLGGWGVGVTSTTQLRLWSQANFGQDLVFCPRGGAGIYYWSADTGVTTRAVNLSELAGASDTPVAANITLVSDASRFVFAFGVNPLGETDIDPLLIRWSDQENPAVWTPEATNQAGDIRLSQGSEITAVIQARQEILVWTDTALYSLQYQGPPLVWGTQILGDNISVASQNAVALASGVVFWMGVDKFYKYDGRVQTLRCDLRQYIYEDINLDQLGQVCCGTNEGFNEVWWFYCSAESDTIDKYVVYNYLEDIWYYGTMARTAWLDTGLQPAPLAATYANTVVQHETGNDDVVLTDVVPINAYITSSEFDIDDGHNFGFVWRLLPDITFRGSDAASPQVTMTLLPLQNSGSGYTNPLSEGGASNAAVARQAVVPVEQFTGQVYIRVRGRQLAMKIESSALGVAWQLGAPRIDIRQDGRR